ncbi:MAG: hypothetical protein U0892_05405 [Pirellulales bacterium]
MFRMLMSVSAVVIGVSHFTSTSFGQEDPGDTKRSERYVALLDDLQAKRMILKNRSSTLMAQSPYLQEEIGRAMQQVLVAQGQLAVTPEVSAIPRLMQSYGGIVGRRSQWALVNPQYTLWYTFQDNTLLRQQLMAQLNTSLQTVQLRDANYKSTLQAINQVAVDADQNFSDFRHLADLMGRRSAREIAEAEARTKTWLQEDPEHAGAGLIEAYSLRTAGRFDEASRTLDNLDDNYIALQSIRLTLAAQVAFLADDVPEAHKQLEQAMRLARDGSVREALLVRAWIFFADGKLSEAKQMCSKLSDAAPEELEAAVIESLVITAQRPKQAKDALKLLRASQIHSSPDDWYYQEAIAIIHAVIGDKIMAGRAMDKALATVPSRFRAELENEKADLQKGNVPQVNWRERLKKQWQIN